MREKTLLANRETDLEPSCPIRAYADDKPSGSGQGASLGYAVGVCSLTVWGYGRSPSVMDQLLGCVLYKSRG